MVCSTPLISLAESENKCTEQKGRGRERGRERKGEVERERRREGGKEEKGNTAAPKERFISFENNECLPVQYVWRIKNS